MIAKVSKRDARFKVIFLILVDQISIVMNQAEAVIDQSLARSNAGAAWVVYSTIPKRVQAAAFYSKDLADRLHQEIYQSEPPVILRAAEVEVTVDAYADQVKGGLTPYTVILEEGELLREDTYDSEIFNITRPGFDPEKPNIFSGTFWASSISDAVDRAQSEWARLLTDKTRE